ncbi:SseB protein [Rivularia sp. PCC 7116]|uniref:enhanced serine sensitivity protein SseB C-terminal domain-containing protein n=1 Tax=Rivularia sp. PCC 7116 TaxID=373994 RepID=UPI00029EDB59|nr:enhanced serine sensitivity protein SseB C-terminal domain-containing protein [Rivularia sp. PCC 7116]AFY57604.1 SseB protein [Rivularia sp. PCC 7116]
MEFNPSNQLEELLVKAANDPVVRNDFYKLILESDIFLVQPPNSKPSYGSRIAGEQESISIQSMEINGNVYLPFFSSFTALQRAIREESDYVSFNARTFFEMTKGQKLLLNPNNDCGKEFTVEEIASLLDGSIFNQDSAREVQSGTEIMIGQPANYPKALVEVLKNYLTKFKSVKSAYLAHFFDPSYDEKPHTLIAIEDYGDWDAVISGLDLCIRNIEIPDPPVDFVKIDSSESYFSDYFKNNCEPFYRRGTD